MREARKPGQKKVIRRQFVSPEVQNADTGPGLQVTEWVFVCAVNTRHTNQKVRMYRKFCIKCTWFSIFRCYLQSHLDVRVFQLNMQSYNTKHIN